MNPTEPAIADLIQNQSYLAECAERARVEHKKDFEWVRREAGPVFTRPVEAPRVDGRKPSKASSSVDPAGGGAARLGRSEGDIISGRY